MQFRTLQARQQSNWLVSLVQLGAAFAICVAMPLVLATWRLPLGWMEPEALNSALAASLGLIGGYWAHRNFGQLPGTRESSAILPGYFIAFASVFLAILMLRIAYSRSVLVMGSALAIIWFYFVDVLPQRRACIALGVVEGGRVALFGKIANVATRRIGIDQWPEGVDAVVADFRHDHSSAWQARLTDFVLAGIPVYHSKDLYESLTGRTDLEHLSENHAGALGPPSSILLAKYLVDRITALPATILLLPLFALVAIAIKLDSPGPVFFRQARVGFRGKPFHVIKFRTMVAGEQRASPRDFDTFITKENDRRITRVGRFLRRSRIDELPQAINILMGQMSWIGPRPEADRLSQLYQDEIHFYRYRHVVRPGITGWAQVNQGHVADVSEIRTKLQYDFYYIRNFSLWLDLLIVMKTIKIMFTGFGHK